MHCTPDVRKYEMRIKFCAQHDKTGIETYRIFNTAFQGKAMSLRKL